MDSTPFRYDIESLAHDMEVDIASLSGLYFEYFLEMKDCIYKSRKACETKEWEKLGRVIHNIKGISNSLNINDIYVIASQLDNELNNHIYDNAVIIINKVNDLFYICEKDIKRFFKQKDITI
jgi:HPt (histidine-containing phosphotransfer) domain-containing protein